MNYIKPMIPYGLITPAIIGFYEEWVYINLYPIIPNMYKISNTGRVINIISNVELSHYIINSGYESVSLSGVDGNRTSYLVHRLVAIHFLPNPYNRETVNHLFGKDRNESCCLEWATQQENNFHARSTGLQNISGDSHYMAKLTNDQVEIICQLIQKGVKYSDILSIIGLENTDNNRDMIGNIKRRIAWTDISMKYDFSEIDGYQSSNSIFTDKMLHDICKALKDGHTIKDIIENVCGIKYVNTKVNSSEYECIRRIKNKKQYTNISDLYF